MKKPSEATAFPAALIDARIAELADCRGETLVRIRQIIKAAVKMTFARGAALDDPAGLVNASLDGNTRRAIDFHEGDRIDEKALNTAEKKKPERED